MELRKNLAKAVAPEILLIKFAKHYRNTQT